jgi:hypothetical protein
MKLFVIFLFLFAKSFGCFSQEAPSIITYNKGGTKYFQNNEKLKQKKLKSILLSTPESKVYFRKYQQEKLISLALFIPFVVNIGVVHNERKPAFFSKKNLVFDLITTVTTSAFVYIMVHQFKQLKKSANAYNKAKQLVLY